MPRAAELGAAGLVETLESRTLFAIGVSEGAPGFFEVTGDSADDAVSIFVDQSARTLSVNGVVYGNAAFVTVYGNGGNDQVSVSGTGGGRIGASISGGEGDDVLSLGSVDGAIWGGPGNDRIDLESVFRGQAYGEGGNDHIVVSGLCTDADVRGGEGDDTIDAQGSSVAVVLYGDNGRDRLYGSPLADILDGGPGRDYLFGRDGDDQFYTRDDDLDYVIGGGGIDTCYCDATEMNISGVEVVIKP